MFCIKCHHTSTKITNSRPHKKQPSIWRRRHCAHCGATFTTLEAVASEGVLTVIAKSGNEPFSFPRLMISLYNSLKGPKNAPDDAYWLAQTIFETIMTTDSPSAVSALRVAETTHDVLERFDATAALKYGLAHDLIKTHKSRAQRPRHYKSPS